MSLKRKLFSLSLNLAVAILLSQPLTVLAKPNPQAISTPDQLISAVNSLRLSYGLTPLAVHPVLMQSAQSQADYMASTGEITHSRPGGGTYTQQLLALGFPLSGDLSLGGFRAENILSSFGPLDWNGVPPAWQDADHMNTMLSQNFTHIGAGISQNGDTYYFALDCAAATNTGQMQESAATIVASAGAENGNAAGVSQFMVPIAKSTARPDGKVYHKVQYGQTLWSIAIDYGTTIKKIQALNNLGEDLTIQQGEELLVLENATPPPPASPTPATLPTILPTLTQLPATPQMVFPFTAVVAPTETQIAPTPATAPAPVSSKLLVIVLIVAAVIGAGVAVWLIRDPKSD
ncbi:MAG: LysM peptidoglycan-binding domain-containing protein [Anaerolineales bacterium]|nr:LysM peptidoglycan-binding domain-containing protein [Anaerolineales bacterium]